MRISVAALIFVGFLLALLVESVPVSSDGDKDVVETSDNDISTKKNASGLKSPSLSKQDPSLDNTANEKPVTPPTVSNKKRPSKTTVRTTTQSSSEDDDSLSPKPKLQLATSCDESKCLLPDCRCSDVKLGGDIAVEKIPQLVTLTFDDAVTALNYETFQEIFEDIRNPDGCEATATFYFSHEYTDYTKVHSLWAQGHELALHSITHGTSTNYWKKASVDLLYREFGQQLDMIEHFAQVDRKDIKGMRMPHFEIPGNNSYVVAKKLGLLYDSSWPTQRFTDPALWPYTLDYKSMQDCPIGRCPDASFPGLWVNPLVNWEDVEGYKCAMIDACIHMPEDDPKDMLEWMISNFNRHYLGNRAPFGAYLHSSWFQKGEHYLQAFKEFIEYMNTFTDVYFVSAARVIEYMQKPVAGKPFSDCPKKHKASCQGTLCQLRKADTNHERWFSTCSPCPEVYPWLNNPLGVSNRTLNELKKRD